MHDGEYWVLKCWVLQVRIVENHQNGKDTHVRGVKIFARDERVGAGNGGAEGKGAEGGVGGGARVERDFLGDVEPDWMKEPELR